MKNLEQSLFFLNTVVILVYQNRNQK